MALMLKRKINQTIVFSGGSLGPRSKIIVRVIDLVGDSYEPSVLLDVQAGRSGLVVEPETPAVLYEGNVLTFSGLDVGLHRQITLTILAIGLETIEVAVDAPRDIGVIREELGDYIPNFGEPPLSAAAAN